MDLSTKGIILGLLFVLGFAAGWHLRGNEDAAATLKVQKQEMKQGNAQNSADAVTATAHQAARDKEADSDRKIGEQVAVAASAPDYHTCQLKPEDLALLNQAIGGSYGQVK
jgi:hypothetical protein